MKVYIVAVEPPYEGMYIDRIFLTRLDAERYLLDSWRNHPSYVTIVEWDVE